MIRKSKQILQFAGGMMLAALVAFLLHPLLWVLIRCGFDWSFLWVAAVCVLVFGTVGAFARWKYWHLSWKELAFRVWAIIVAILFIILMVFIYWPRYINFGEGIRVQHLMDGMTALLFFLDKCLCSSVFGHTYRFLLLFIQTANRLITKFFLHHYNRRAGALEIWRNVSIFTYLCLDNQNTTKMGALTKDFISNKLKPLLKQRGYVKKGNSFLRQSGDMIYIVNIQGSVFNSWHEHEEFFVNVGIVSTMVENAVGHTCSIKETSPSKLLFFQVNLRAEELVPIKNKSYTISEAGNADQCLADILLVDEKFNQIKSLEDLYPFLFISCASKRAWESTYMKYWAMNGEWSRFDEILEDTAQFCKRNDIETLSMKEWKTLCQEYGHKHPAILY